MTQLGRDTIRAAGRPSPQGIALLVLCALALVATSPSLPSVEGRAIGEVILGGAASADRVLRIHLEETRGSPTRGTIAVTPQAASGLDAAYDPEVAVTLLPATDEDPPLEPGALPVERCTSGCDLAYRVRVETGPSVLPASVIRYAVDVRFEYAGYGSLDSSLLRLDLDGAATGPVAPIWALIAGVLALVGGIAGGPAVDGALGAARRRWPARGLVVLACLPLAWILVYAVGFVAGLGSRGLELLADPLNLLRLVSPWSTGLLLVLAWGVRRGLGRWVVDGGWGLGLAAVASIGLGGLWLAWWTTASASVQPIALALPFVALGGLGGVVIGQAWRTDPAARHDRWWAALAVLAHGVVIAGFGFLAQSWLYDPFGSTPASLLAIVPAVLVALGFRRWLRGRQRWLVAFDALIATAGLLGIWFWTAFPYASGGQQLALDDVAVGIAIAASFVALATSLHAMPRTSPGVDPAAPVDTAPPADRDARDVPTPAGVADPPTR